MKNRLLLILEYLYTNTDSDQHVTIQQIRDMLAKNDYPNIDRRSILRDIQALIDYGHEIESEEASGLPTEYWVANRKFETIELQLLIIAVGASQFIGVDRSHALIEKLSHLAGITDR